MGSTTFLLDCVAGPHVVGIESDKPHLLQWLGAVMLRDSTFERQTPGRQQLEQEQQQLQAGKEAASGGKQESAERPVEKA